MVEVKPLASQKAPRLDPGVEPLREWLPAEHHLTHDGQREFMARMKARIAAADKARKANAAEVEAKVAPITSHRERKA